MKIILAIAAAAALSLAPTTAHASARVCDALAGNPWQGNRIEVCQEIIGNPWSPRWAQVSSSLLIESRATGATGCKTTSWLSLRKDGHVWTSPRATLDCSHALRKGNWYGFGGAISKTSAHEAQGHVCIDLYYKGSSRSGWQRCAGGLWTRW